MAGLVEGGVALLLLRHDHRLALGAHHDLVLGLLELDHLDELLAAPGRKQRRLVDDVLEVCPREPRRAAGDDGGVHVFGQRHPLHVDLEDLLAPANVRQRHHHLSVEAARTQERGVQHVRAVGGGDDDDAVVGLEAVHFHQELVQGLLALVVAAAQALRHGAGRRRRFRR